MKILYITNLPSPYRVDFFNELCKYCNLTVIFERNDAKNRDPVWWTKRRVYFNRIFLNGWKFGLDNVISFEIIKYLRTNTFDIIVVGGYSTFSGILSISYLSLKKIPFVLNCDGGFVRNNEFLKYYIKKFLIGRAEWWICSGDKASEYLCFYGAKREKIYIYPFTSIRSKYITKIPISNSEKKRMKLKLKIDEYKMVLSVGQFIKRKGFDVLLKACEKIDQNVGIYIIGGVPTNEYINIVNKLQLQNIHFLDFKSSTELKKYFISADLFVLPTREDIWGLVINEAMASGLPVITTTKCVAGIELIKNSINGFIIDIDNRRTLANKINKILNNRITRKRFSKNSINKIREYTIENMAMKHIEIFEKIYNIDIRMKAFSDQSI